MKRIAFTLPDVGLNEVKGLAYLEDGFLVLRVESALLGMIDPEKDLIKIEPKALRDVRIRRGLFKDRLVLEPKEPTLLDAVPGEHPNTLELRVWRKHRRDLEDFVDAFDRLLF